MKRVSIKQIEQLRDRAEVPFYELVELYRARKKAGILQKQIAGKLGVSVTTFDNYEAGVRRPPLHLLAEWRAALGLTDLEDCAGE